MDVVFYLAANYCMDVVFYWQLIIVWTWCSTVSYLLYGRGVLVESRYNGRRSQYEKILLTMDYPQRIRIRMLM